MSYLAWLEKTYGLVRCTPSLAEGLKAAEEWLQQPDLRQAWQARRQRLLEDSDDLNEFIYRLIEKTAAGRRAGSSGDAG